MSEQRLRIPQYLILYTPALDWILQCLTHEAPEVLLTEVLEKCRNRANRYDFVIYQPLITELVSWSTFLQHVAAELHHDCFPAGIHRKTGAFVHQPNEGIRRIRISSGKRQTSQLKLENFRLGSLMAFFSSSIQQHILFRTLGLCLVITEPKEEEKLQVLNDVWKAVIKLRNPAVSNLFWR